MKLYVRIRTGLTVAALALASVTPCVHGDKTGGRGLEANIRITGGLRLVRVCGAADDGMSLQAGSGALEETDYPRPPLAGFSPLVAITTSDQGSREEFEWEHVVQSSYVGSPLNPPATENFVIGIFDSGAVIDLAAAPSDLVLGLTGAYLTPNDIPLSGVGGTVSAILSQPIGMFAAGLAAVQPGGQLDLNQVVGHTNVSVGVAPEISCGPGESVTAVVGTPLIAFFTTVIRPDTPRTVTVNNETITAPDVQLLDPFDPSIPVYPRSIAMEFGGPAPVTTASFYGDIFGDFKTPITPTLLSMDPLSLPFGGAFFAQIGVLQGEPGPTNPIQNMRVLVDTGAQSSIMSTAMAANLSLPVQPHFTVSVCGVGGLVEDVPGYYIDYVKINALGGALEFSRAPFVVLDLESPEGGPLDGVLGMNFFWDRNIVFEPSLSLSGFLHVSDPIGFAYGDFDRDFDVDQDDYAFFQACTTGPAILVLDPQCAHVDADGDADIDQSDFGIFQACLSGPDVPADPNCSQRPQ